jgi:Fe2+ or Zn2+ uptake regulation protein
VERSLPRYSKRPVYELNLVQRIHPTRWAAHLPAANPNQHILLCQGCGHVTFFKGDISSLAEVISKKTGYTLDLSLIQFLGCVPIANIDI